MKIKELRVLNYLGIEDVTIHPSEKGSSIEGTSRKGKTSILNAIAQAVTNDNPRTKIIRDDKSPAKLYIEMDDGHIINRTFSPDGKKDVRIEKDGVRPSAPETYLRKILGARVVSIDPRILLFGSGREKELSDTILSLLPISIKKEDTESWIGESPMIDYRQHGLTALKDIERNLYERRTDINRALNDTTTKAAALKESLPPKYDVDFWRKKSLGDIYGKIEKGRTINEERQRLQETIDQEAKDLEIIEMRTENAKQKVEDVTSSMITNITNEIRDLEMKIQVLKEGKQRLEKEKDGKKLDVQKQGEKAKSDRKEITKRSREKLAEYKPVDISGLKTQAEETEKMQRLIPIATEAKDLAIKAETLKEESENLTKRLTTIRNKPAELLAKMKMPIADLSISDEGMVLIKGLPLKNQSTSELAELLCDIEIAKTSDVQFVCIDGWESMGEEIQEILQRKFTEAGIQLFYTKVTTGELKIRDL